MTNKILFSLTIVLALFVASCSTNIAGESVTVVDQPADEQVERIEEVPIEQPTEQQRLSSDDVTYVGSFRVPALQSHGHGMAYNPNGDTDGTDEFTGSLLGVSHSYDFEVMEFKIPIPQQLGDDSDTLPVAELIQGPFNIAEGIEHDMEHFAMLFGMLYHSDKIYWVINSRYNVGAVDHATHGFSGTDFENIEAEGLFNIGEEGDDATHAAKTSKYMFKTNEKFAEEHFDGKMLVTGHGNPVGASSIKQGIGPSAYAINKYDSESTDELKANPLFYYTDENPFPEFCSADEWNGGAWISDGDKNALILVGIKGLGESGYKDPDACQEENTGYVCVDGYVPKILFYDPEDLANVYAGELDPWAALPYDELDLTEFIESDCRPSLRSLAHDQENNLLYVNQDGDLVHVFRIG